jgi:hypothetical protein
MPAKARTYIFCYDDYRSFSEDIIRRFPDEARYKVFSFQVSGDLLSCIEKEKEKALCRVSILGMHDNLDQVSLIENLSQEIRNIDPDCGIILLVPPGKTEEVKKSKRFNSTTTYIPRNSNAVLRIHNTVKSLISERNIIRFRKRRNMSFSMMLIFIVLCLILVIFAKIKLPMYF